jgi:hypothetical protein
MKTIRNLRWLKDDMRSAPYLVSERLNSCRISGRGWK